VIGKSIMRPSYYIPRTVATHEPIRIYQRTPGRRIQVGEKLIIAEGAELGAELHLKVAFGERGLYRGHRGLGDGR